MAMSFEELEQELAKIEDPKDRAVKMSAWAKETEAELRRTADQRDENLKESLKRKDKLRELSGRLEGFEKVGLSPEELVELAELRKKGKKPGAEPDGKDWEKMEAELKRAHAEEVGKLTSSLTTMQSQIRQFQVERPVRASLEKAGVLPEAMDDALRVVLGLVQYDDEGKAAFVKSDGSPLTDGKGNRFTLESIGEYIAKEKPYFLKNRLHPGDGQQAAGKGPTALTDADVKRLWDNPDELAKYLEENPESRDILMKRIRTASQAPAK